MRKKSPFELKLAGVKDAISNGVRIPVLYHLEGDFSVIFKITNSVTQFMGDKKQYQQFHRIISDILKLIGEGYTVQKIDIFCTSKYKAKEEDDYLQEKFEKHFNGRTFNDSISYFIITKNITRSSFFNFKEQVFETFLKKIQKIESILAEQNFKPVLLDEDQIDLLMKRFLAQNFTDEHFSLKNFEVNDETISFSNKTLKTISLVDVDETNFPTTIKPYSIQNRGRDFPADIVSFLQSTPGCDNVIYNQVIKIPDQRKSITDLEVKKRRHTSMPDPANLVCVEDIDNVLGLIQRTNDLIVQSHFDVILYGDHSKISTAENYIESHLSKIGIIPSNNAYNQLELFTNAFPGNTAGLNEKYDLFQTTALPAACLLYKESPPQNEDGTFRIKLTDRKGIPVTIDTSDLPMQTGMITNRNKFVLGPSGSGKSFFMNTFTQQSHYQDTDIVIVDTGHSYSGLCSYVGGRYIEYSEERPITMNPFRFTYEEYNEEKRDFLKSLVALLWKGADGNITPVENTALGDIIRSYYAAYFVKEPEFKADFNSFYEFSIKEIKKIREQNHILLDTEGYTYVLKQFYKGGVYDKILNNDSDSTLFEDSFIVFEIDNIKDNPVLFPITTLIIMDVFLQKMRVKKGRKSLIIEEAWKAIASPMMASYILYVYKTVRKWNGEAILVTQELDDIIGNETIKNSVINNSDTIILLDQAKFLQNYDQVAEILSLDSIEQNKIFTINQLDNKDNRSRFMEVYIKRGRIGDVYGVEVSLEQYLIFTTERKEKEAVKIYVESTGSYRDGVNAFVKDLKESNLSLGAFCSQINSNALSALKKTS